MPTKIYTMKKILTIIAGLVVLLLVAVVVVLATLDVNQYKGEIIKLVQDKTGRKFDVAGELKLGISLIPTIKVEQVTLGNAEWGSTPEMVKIKSFEMQVGLLPLLSGDIKVSQLVLDTAEIMLETNKDGTGNWMFAKEDKSDDKSAPSSGATKINVSQINIKSSTLSYKDGKTGKLTQAKIDEFVLEGGAFTTALDVVLKAVYNEVPINIEGSLGSLASFIDNESFPLDIKAGIGDATASIKGNVEEPKTMKGLDLELNFKAASLAPFATILDRKLPETGAVSLTGHITESEGVYTLTAVNAEALASKLKLDGTLAAAEPLKEFDLNINFDTTSLTNFNSLKEYTGREFPESGPVSLQGHISEKDGFYLLDAVNAALGKDLISLNGKVSSASPAQEFELDIKANTENLSKFDALAGQKLPAVGPLQLAGQVSGKDGIYLFKAVTAQLPKSKLTVDGKLTDVKKTDGSNLNINFQSESLADLNGLTGSQLPPLAPVSLIANVSDSKGSYHLKDMKFNAGKTDLTGNMTINMKGERPAVAATLNSNLIDLTPFAGEKPEDKKAKKDKVFSKDPLPLEGLKTVDANLDVTAKQVKTADMELENVKLVMTLTNGKLALKPLNATTSGSNLALQMDLDASNPKSANVKTRIDIKNFQPSSLPKYKDKFTGGKTDVAIDVSGAGNSVANIMAGLNGKFLAQMGAGTFKSSATSAATADAFSSLKSAIYGGKDSGSDTQINCGVINLNIKDGIATADKGIAINTSKMNIIGSGVINLKTEELDIAIDPQAREGVGISAGQLAELVKIGGTLAEPKAVPSTEAALKTAASAGAALATGGLSILAQGMFDKSTADEDPCATALGKKSTTKPAEKTTTTTTTKTEEAPKSTSDKAVDAVKDTGSAIKEGFKGLFD